MKTRKKKYCPCGSANAYEECCGVVIENQHLADTPEKLMRSRYTAFTLNLIDYIKTTWAQEKCPNDISKDQETNWLGLTIVDTHKDCLTEHEGYITFTAKYIRGNIFSKMTEKSRFIRRRSLWLYFDGDLSLDEKVISSKSLCPCESGKKFKRCCGKN